MDRPPIAELSLSRISNALGSDDGYALWFDLPPQQGDATTPELTSLCIGALFLGQLAARMHWDWPTLLRYVDRLAAPLEDYVLLEVKHHAVVSNRLRRAVHESVAAAGLDPYKVKIIDSEHAESYILGHGLPPH